MVLLWLTLVAPSSVPFFQCLWGDDLALPFVDLSLPSF